MESFFRLTPGWAMHKNHDHVPPNLWPFVIICIWFKTCIDWYWMCDKFREKMWEAPIQNWPQQARMCYSWVNGIAQEHLGSLWSFARVKKKPFAFCSCSCYRPFESAWYTFLIILIGIENHQFIAIQNLQCPPTWSKSEHAFKSFRTHILIKLKITYFSWYFWGFWVLKLLA